MATNKNYTVTFGTLLDTKQLEKQTKAIESKKRNLKFTTDDKALDSTTRKAKNLSKALNDTDQSAVGALLTFQAANMVLSRTVDILSSMTEEVFAVNGAITEFKKVTDLSGGALDKYASKLSDMGASVARTGKPKCLSQNVRMGNVH